jgi:outer membrane protein assembly factor BamB
VERPDEPVDPDTTRGQAVFSANGFKGIVEGGVAVGFNNDLYIATHSGTPKDTLFAFTPQGSIRWKAELGPVRSSPVVGNNEDIFVASEDGRLYGFSSTGKRLWPPYNTGAVIRSSPAFGAEGYIFFGDSEGNVHAVNSFDGLPVVGWPVRPTNVAITVPPVITRDHTVIVAASDGYVWALRPDGRTLWKSSTNIGSVSVGMALVEREFEITLPNGQTARTKNTVVYIVSNSGRIYALTVDTNGSINWEYPLTGPLRSAPVVGPDGTIYVGTSTGMTALNEEVDQFTPRLRFIHVANDVGTPAIDSNENVYFVSGERVIAINPNNMPLWEFDLKMEADGPLTIGRNGLLYVAGSNGVLYGLSTNSVGLAREKWPMFQRNSRHTGRLGNDATDG